MIEEILREALEMRKFSPGEVQFARSELHDPHIQRVMNAIVDAFEDVTYAEVEEHIATKLAKFTPMIEVAPLLYNTIKNNLVENEVFTLFWKLPERVDPEGAPVFKERTFFKLVRMIAAEHDEFWPLRSYIDGRKLQPRFEFVGGDSGQATSAKYGNVDTAAATPDGVFIFNIDFMQKLIDYAAIKGIQPKGKKYEANGGDLPNGYAYIEFVILHEFMHYTNDDFHYQKVIPNSNPQIINWVGDFRSNYLLVKSGYEQLPMGLFNDAINYDRQKTYIEMYNIVKDEMEKLKQEPSPDQDGKGKKGEPSQGGSKGQGSEGEPSDGEEQSGEGKGRTLADDVSDALDKMGDDHKPGTEEGKTQSTDGMTEGDIDKAGKRAEEEMKEGKDLSPGEAGAAQKAGQGKSMGIPGTGGTNGTSDSEYANYKPTFNWKTLVGKMISKATVRMEETFSKPSRRSVSSMEIARQVGAAAIKPGEKQSEFAQIKLAFCIDSSGSMGEVIGPVMSNVANLLRTPQFAKTECIVSKFSSSAEVFKVNFYRDAAAKVANYKDKPDTYNLKVNDVLGVHFGAGTTLSEELTSQLEQMIRDKWNVVLVSDADVLHSLNYGNLMRLIKAGPANMFVIFSDQPTYAAFRTKAGITTPNITYFQ